MVALTLLMVAGTVNYLDRSALSIGNSSIRASLHLSDAEMGLLLSAFAVAYGVAQLPVGVLIDRFGPRRVMTVGLLLWSASQAAAGFVGSLGQFLVARRRARGGRVADVPGRDQGVLELVPGAGAGVPDRTVQRVLGAGAGDRAAGADRAAGGVRLAIDVRDHRRGRAGGRGVLGGALPRSRPVRDRAGRAALDPRRGRGGDDAATGSRRSGAGAPCSGIAPAGAWRRASSA